MISTCPTESVQVDRHRPWSNQRGATTRPIGSWSNSPAVMDTQQPQALFFWTWGYVSSWNGGAPHIFGSSIVSLSPHPYYGYGSHITEVYGIPTDYGYGSHCERMWNRWTAGCGTWKRIAFGRLPSSPLNDLVTDTGAYQLAYQWWLAMVIKPANRGVANNNRRFANNKSINLNK